METRMNEDLWNNRPDLCITKLEGTRWKSSYGYGEIKSSTLGGINYHACYDLFKVAIFCKNALDTQKMKGMQEIQAIGWTLRFCLVTLPFSGLYIMYELANIKVPGCLEDLPKLLMDLPSIILILDVFDRLCIRSTDSPQPSRHRPTIIISTFNSILSSSKNNKRPCTLKMIHN